MNETEQHSGLGISAVQRMGETSSNAMAQKQRSLVEARYVMAYNRPRNALAARTAILDALKRPLFAEAARYAKPVGGASTAKGWSVRFAEEALRAWGNVAVEACTVWDDDQKRIVQITVTDLESNATFGEEITVNKQIERKFLKEGQQPISKRVNSKGEITYLVEATEDDVLNKTNALKSKSIRNCGLRLIGSDLQEEALAQYHATMRDGGSDPKASLKKVVDAFASLNIGAGELDGFLGHGLATASPAEIIELREMFAAIRDGEATWADYEKKAQPKSKPGFVDPKNEPRNENAATSTSAGAQAAEPQTRASQASSTRNEKKPANVVPMGQSEPTPNQDPPPAGVAAPTAADTRTTAAAVVKAAEEAAALKTPAGDGAAPATAPSGTPQAELEKQLTVGGIGLEHFMIWMIKTERHKEAAYTSWADIPTAVAETVLKDKRGLANCIKLKSAYAK